MCMLNNRKVSEKLKIRTQKTQKYADSVTITHFFTHLM